MNALVQRLRAELRFDRDAFAKRVAELGSVDLGPASGPAPHAQAAVALHHAYGSIEAIMTRLARQLDGDLPAGADWHQSLLHVMGLAIEGVRPAVFSPESVRVLRELMSFRHFFRHAYAVDLDAGRLDTLRRRLITAAPRLLAEIDTLDRFLSVAAHDE
ncbi:hypothetical protein [uncultured Thiodictyon sp.]|uniref:ribonuclease toxin HepT-like protein n=1 Tax=uncultured Thiodictyon sp. TaxID=1846217 RepID=UPI0025F87316|nr:hypothetical protein [uncultured Thiodictyon sp.]